MGILMSANNVLPLPNVLHYLRHIDFAGCFYAKPSYSLGVVYLSADVNEGFAGYTPIVQTVAPNSVVVFFGQLLLQES